MDILSEFLTRTGSAEGASLRRAGLALHHAVKRLSAFPSEAISRLERTLTLSIGGPQSDVFLSTSPYSTENSGSSFLIAIAEKSVSANCRYVSSGLSHGGIVADLLMSVPRSKTPTLRKGIPRSSLSKIQTQGSSRIAWRRFVIVRG